jgi:hypothetical protein
MEDTMSHDKIKAAARRRMAQTGEPYAAARRKVIKEYQATPGENPGPGARWFAISYSKTGMDRITASLDTLFGGGPGRSGAEVDSDEIRVRMADFRQNIPRSSVRSVTRSAEPVHGTTGVHVSRGRLLVNGSTDDLVELAIEPPCHTSRTLATMYTRQRVNRLILSLADPDGFIAALTDDRHAKPGTRH